MDIDPIELQKHLKGARYPASREDLVALAEGNDAPEEVLDALRGMPSEELSGPDDVMEAVGSS